MRTPTFQSPNFSGLRCNRELAAALGLQVECFSPLTFRVFDVTLTHGRLRFHQASFSPLTFRVFDVTSNHENILINP